MMIVATLDSIVQSVRRFPQLRKHELNAGDWVIVRTINSVYMLHVLDDGSVVVSGGWFDKKGNLPMRIGVSGATWGGSSIMPNVFAAIGMRIEFRNRMITSPVRSIRVIPGSMMN